MKQRSGRLGMGCSRCGVQFPSRTYKFWVAGYDSRGNPIPNVTYFQCGETCPKCRGMAMQIDGMLLLEKKIEQLYDRDSSKRPTLEELEKLQKENERLRSKLGAAQESAKFKLANAVLRCIDPGFAIVLSLAKVLGMPRALVGGALLVALKASAMGSNRTVREMFHEEIIKRIQGWMDWDDAA